MDCSMPGFPVLYYLSEFAQTHVHWIGDAIQPSHPLSRLSPPTLNLPHNQGLFQWISSSHQSGQSIGASASVLPMNIQGWFPLGLTGLISLLSKGLSEIFSSTTVWKHQFFCGSAFLIVQLSYPYMAIEKPKLLLDGPLLAKWCLCFWIYCLDLS